jgi:hypothetical protein
MHRLTASLCLAASAVAVASLLPARAHVSEAQLLSFLNAPDLTAERLAVALDGDAAKAQRLLDARPFASLNAVAAVEGIGPATIARLEDWLGVPLPPDTEAELEADADLQHRLALDYLRYAIEARVWHTWQDYPGIPNRVQSDPPLLSGISHARPLKGSEAREETWGWLDPAHDDDRYRSAGTSLFNASSSAYVASNLWPLETFKERIVARDVEIEFPYDSAIVKLLFLQIPPGLEKDQGRVVGLDAPAPVGPNGEVLRPLRVIEHPSFGTMGLVQVDISTKQYNAWTWMTFKYDPDQGDPRAWSLSPQLRDDTWLQTSYDQRYMGPVDNKRSSCIACHQMAQFPRVRNFTQGVAQPDHHQVRDAPYGSDLTKRDVPSMFVDYVWEVTQSLEAEETLKGRLTIDDYPLPLNLGPGPALANGPPGAATQPAGIANATSATNAGVTAVLGGLGN